MILNEAERQKFAAYLRQNIESAKLMVGQLRKLPSNIGIDALVGIEKKRIAGWIITLEELENTESFEVG